MRLSIFGSSQIINHHINAAIKNSFKIHSICTSNKNSSNVKNLAKKYKIKNVYYNWKKFLKDCSQNNASVLIAGRIIDNEKILMSCLNLNLIVIIEKPVFTDPKKFNKFLKFKKNIFVGYNRIFYKNIQKVQEILDTDNLLNVSIKCPEINRKNISINTCHVISIIYYIFNKIYLIKKIKKKDSIFCIFITKKKIPIFININFNSPDNFSIEFILKKKRLKIKPLENLKIYNKLIKKKYKNTNIYVPNLSETIDEYAGSNFKPGFENQYKNFKKFIQNKKCNHLNIQHAKEIIEICQVIEK